MVICKGATGMGMFARHQEMLKSAVSNGGADLFQRDWMRLEEIYSPYELPSMEVSELVEAAHRKREAERSGELEILVATYMDAIKRNVPDQGNDLAENSATDAPEHSGYIKKLLLGDTIYAPEILVVSAADGPYLSPHKDLASEFHFHIQHMIDDVLAVRPLEENEPVVEIHSEDIGKRGEKLPDWRLRHDRRVGPR
jgi:hypothetical protein